MLVLVIFGVILLTTDAALGKCIEGSSLQMPDGMSVHKVIATWQEAHFQCLSEGAVLASPINAEVLHSMKSLIGVNNTAYFIGIKATHYPGPFLSVEGVPLDSMTAAVLEMVQQLDPRDGDCLSMDRYSIRVVPCCSRLPYMCYKSQTEQNTTTEEKVSKDTTTEEYEENVSKYTTEETVSEKNQEDTAIEIKKDTEIPEGDNMIQLLLNGTLTCGTSDPEYIMCMSTGSCYKKHTETAYWSDAEETCRNEGGHLAVIDNMGEQQVIMELYPDSVWWIYIGLRNRGPSEGWWSVTNQSVSDLYNSWIDGTGLKSPNYCCGLLKFIGLLDWDTCDKGQHPFLCEKDIVYLASSTSNDNQIDKQQFWFKV